MSKFYINELKAPFKSGQQVIEVRDDGSVAFIPMVETNADYREYLKWVEEGNTPEPWNPEENK